MNRIDRLMAVTTTLQSKKYVSAEYLAEKYSISVRTVYRDLKSLIEIGIPIGFENQEGYFIVQGYFLPPVSFTNEEANALILMDTLAQRFGDKSIKKHYSTALSKIKAVLKGSEKDKVDYLHNQIKSYVPPEYENDCFYLSDIQKAISNKNILTIDYINAQKIKSKRDIEPIGLLFYALNWHLIAWCWERNDYRDFRATNILHLQNDYKSFRKKDHINFNDDYLEKYFMNH
jgi:predicted DNA-binding transcriptional regulator YafY